MPQIAALLGVDPKTVHRWPDAGVFPPTIHLDGIIRWRAEDLDDFLPGWEARATEGRVIGRGRALGPGRLFRRGKAWVLEFREAGGQRRNWTLGPDKRVAEARRLELIIQRNMELEGLGSSEGRRRGLVEIAELYLADLRARVSPMHLKNLEIRLGHTLAALGERRVGDLKPHDLVRLRSEATQAGKSNRTANLVEPDGEPARTAR